MALLVRIKIILAGLLDVFLDRSRGHLCLRNGELEYDLKVGSEVHFIRAAMVSMRTRNKRIIYKLTRS